MIDKMEGMLILKFRMISILLEASTQQAKVKVSITEGEMTSGVSNLAAEMSMTMTNLINPTEERNLGMISIQLEGTTIHMKTSILAGELTMTMTNLINPTKERTLGMISIQLEGTTIHMKTSILVVIEEMVSTLT
jgi:hypothetical protein